MNLVARQIYGNKSAEVAFTSTWNTTLTSTGSSASNQIKIPLSSATSINSIVDWGDGSSDVITVYNQAQLTHTYASSGVYTVKIIGNFNGGFYFNNTGDKLKLTGISSFGNIILNTNQSNAFYGCANLTSLPDDCVTQMNLVTTGTSMFYQCTSLTSLPTGMTLNSLTNGTYMFLSITIDKTRYSQLLIDMNASNTNTGVTFHGGNSKYDTAGQTARNLLTARSPAWVITDGGYEP